MDATFLKRQVETISPQPFIGKAYRPVNIRIGRHEAPSLYNAEERRTFWIEKSADEWCSVLGYDAGNPRHKWPRAMPQVLYDLLDGFDCDAAEAAAVAFLQMRGYDISVQNWPAARRNEPVTP